MGFIDGANVGVNVVGFDVGYAGALVGTAVGLDDGREVGFVDGEVVG